jgi:hypothetical protein
MVRIVNVMAKMMMIMMMMTMRMEAIMSTSRVTMTVMYHWK